MQKSEAAEAVMSLAQASADCHCQNNTSQCTVKSALAKQYTLQVHEQCRAKLLPTIAHLAGRVHGLELLLDQDRGHQVIQPRQHQQCHVCHLLRPQHHLTGHAVLGSACANAAGGQHP